MKTYEYVNHHLALVPEALRPHVARLVDSAQRTDDAFTSAAINQEARDQERFEAGCKAGCAADSDRPTLWANVEHAGSSWRLTLVRTLYTNEGTAILEQWEPSEHEDASGDRAAVVVAAWLGGWAISTGTLSLDGIYAAPPEAPLPRLLDELVRVGGCWSIRARQP